MSHDYVYHHGIKGMRWGIRRFQNKDGTRTEAGKKRYSIESIINRRKEKEAITQQKLKAIKKTQGAGLDPNDRRRFEYRSNPYAKRLAGHVATAATQMLLGDVLTGKVQNYSKMSKKELASKIGKVAATSVVNTTLNDKMAESAMKRYQSNGRKKKKNGFVTKEDLIEVGISSAVSAAPALSLALNLKMSQVAAKNKANRERFEAWGGNILNEKVDNIIWQSDDLKTAVIDNRR